MLPSGSANITSSSILLNQLRQIRSSSQLCVPLERGTILKHRQGDRRARHWGRLGREAQEENALAGGRGGERTRGCNLPSCARHTIGPIWAEEQKVARRASICALL